MSTNAKRTTELETLRLVCLVCAMALVATPSSVFATVYDFVFGTPVEALEVPLNQSRIVVFDKIIGNVSIGNPVVADIVVLDAKKLYVVGRKLGSTNVVVWDKEGESRSYTTFTVDVTHDLVTLRKNLHELMPDEHPEVRSTQGALILTGELSSAAKVEAVAGLAKQYVQNAKALGGAKEGVADKDGTEIINLLQVGGPHQVILDVKIAEISRTAMKRLGINLAAYSPGRPWKFGAVNGGSSFPAAKTPDNSEIPLFPNDQSWYNQSDAMIGPSVADFKPTVPAISAAGLFASFLNGSSYFNFVIDASKEDGLAKILAEPTLTALSGESAQFLSGGEFPVPIWSGEDNRTTIVFKEFGIAVKMLPVVLDSKRINLTLNLSVSELSNAANVTFGVPSSSTSYSVPSLTTRSASSTVELLDGQTIGIAGLISDKLRESMNKFPGLGDVPVLGALFRSQVYQQDQSELVMFVTAHLAKPIAPDLLRLPTDAFVAPDDAEFFLMGRIEGRGRTKLAAAKEARQLPAHKETGRATPTFGHQL